MLYIFLKTLLELYQMFVYVGTFTSGILATYGKSINIGELSFMSETRTYNGIVFRFPVLFTTHVT